MKKPTEQDIALAGEIDTKYNEWDQLILQGDVVLTKDRIEFIAALLAERRQKWIEEMKAAQIENVAVPDSWGRGFNIGCMRSIEILGGDQ